MRSWSHILIQTAEAFGIAAFRAIEPEGVECLEKVKLSQRESSYERCLFPRARELNRLMITGTAIAMTQYFFVFLFSVVDKTR
ncbi:MAG: hypothetical protein ACREBS_09325 [Nitrososphaerales archaeon]